MNMKGSIDEKKEGKGKRDEVEGEEVVGKS